MWLLSILACNWSIPPPSLVMYVSCNTMKEFVDDEREKFSESSFSGLLASLQTVIWRRSNTQSTLLMCLWRKYSDWCIFVSISVSNFLSQFLFPVSISILFSAFQYSWIHIPTDLYTFTLHKNQACAQLIHQYLYILLTLIQSLFGHLFCHTSNFFLFSTYSERSRSSIQALALSIQQESGGCLSVTHKGV